MESGYVQQGSVMRNGNKQWVMEFHEKSAVRRHRMQTSLQEHLNGISKGEQYKERWKLAQVERAAVIMGRITTGEFYPEGWGYFLLKHLKEGHEICKWETGQCRVQIRRTESKGMEEDHEVMAVMHQESFEEPTWKCKSEMWGKGRQQDLLTTGCRHWGREGRTLALAEIPQ